MKENSIWQELKDVSASLAGRWYAEAIEQTLIFSICEKPLVDAKLVVIEKSNKPTENVYTVGAYLGDKLESLFYIDIGNHWDNKRWYKINQISSNKLTIVEIEKAAGRKEISKEFAYIRKKD